MKKYDFLIVGAGLYGAVFAYKAKQKGKTCLVVDKRPHIGGNVYTENVNSIDVHKYGAHIFHTNNKTVWDFVNQFATFNNYINSPVAISKGKMYNLPFNMNTFYQLWNTKTPSEAMAKIKEQTQKHQKEIITNLEEQSLALVGKDLYETLIKEYTEKQWGKPANQLPSFIIKRIPIRFTFNNNYFYDKYQGIPEKGYTKMVENILDETEVRLNCDFFAKRNELTEIADKIIFTGMIDEYYDYRYGELEYRSLEFMNETHKAKLYQGNAVINYIDKEIPYTRIIEHKLFTDVDVDFTITSKEYPIAWTKGKEAFYPINDERNSSIFNKYKKLAESDKKVFFGGRLGEYKYYDMDKIIEKALVDSDEILK